MERLVVEAIKPIVDALENSGDINGKLISGNSEYLINWFLEEIKDLLRAETVSKLRHKLPDIQGCGDCTLK